MLSSSPYAADDVRNVAVGRYQPAVNVRHAAQYEEILVTDSGKSVAKLVPLNESPKRSSFKDWQPSPEFAAIMHRPVGGTDSTQIISEDRDRT